MIDAVIFDMDGLLFDTEGIWAECWKPALAEVGLPYMEGIADATRGTAAGTFARVVHEWFGADADAERLWDVWHRIAEDRFERGIVKMPGVDELLECLSQRGISAAVASSSMPDQIERNLRNTSIDYYFSATVSSVDVAQAKPAPDVFLKAAELLGADPAHSLVLEDSYNGVRAGAAGGFYTIMVPDLAQPNDEMKAIASKICDSLLDVRDLISSGALQAILM